MMDKSPSKIQQTLNNMVLVCGQYKEVLKMMYSFGLVCSLKCNGKILREDKDLISLPFCSEYSILLKNLESRKAKVNITIDGQDVLDGNSLVLNPNSEIELEGFMKGNKGKNKFKFIQKTKEISDYRGDRIDDGIIRVEYWFEKFIEKRQIINEVWTQYPTYFPYNRYTSSSGGMGGSCYGEVGSCGGGGTASSSSNNIGGSVSCYNASVSVPLQDEGITVKGSEINQQFTTTWVSNLEEQSKVIILRLQGYSKNGTFIQEPVTVNKKITCGICGKKSRSNIKYCSSCGSYLE